MTKQNFALFIALSLGSTFASAEALPVDLSTLTAGLDFSVVLPLILAAGAAVIGWDVIKGGIMGVIGMISSATRR